MIKEIVFMLFVTLDGGRTEVKNIIGHNDKVGCELVATAIVAQAGNFGLSADCRRVTIVKGNEIAKV